MPLYDYECSRCGAAAEEFISLVDLDTTMVCCETCGIAMDRIISSHIQRDEPTWLNDAIGNLQPSGTDVKPIESRCEYKKYLGDNGIIATG